MLTPNNYSNRGSPHILELNSGPAKTLSTLNSTPAGHDLNFSGKNLFPTLQQSSHKRTKSHYQAIKFDQAISQGLDTVVRSQGSVSHRTSRSLPKGVGLLNMKKLDEPFSNGSLHVSKTTRGTVSRNKARFMELESRNSHRHPTETYSPTSGSPRMMEMEDLGYVKQEEYIKKNPHFQKFHDSLHTIDKAETIKFSFPREFYWTPEQLELNQRMVKSITRRNSRPEEQIKILKEGIKELIDLPKGKVVHYKIKAEDKVFPLLIKIMDKIGSFEALVSRSESIVNRKEYDYVFSTNDCRIHYDNAENIPFVYIAITATERLKMCISVTFSPSEEKKPKPSSKAKLTIKRDKSKGKKGIYEFFHEGMRNEEFIELKEMAEEIRREKRMRSLSLANFKDLIQENIQTARQYQQVKVIQLHQIFSKREELQRKNNENKMLVKIQKEKQALINAYKFKIKRIEQEWKERQERERRERIAYQTKWAVSFAVTSILQAMIEKKRARIIVRIFEKQRETKVIKIQRLARKFLQRPIVLKTGPDRHFLNSLSSRIAVLITEGLNSIALTAYKSKMAKAQTLVSMTLETGCVPIGIVNAFEKYYNTVVMIQKRWKNQMEMFHARVQVFLAHWHQFCLSLLSKEAKKKKKRYTEIIPHIKETRVTVFAKQYIQDKMTAFLRELRDYHNKNSVDENSDDTISLQMDKTFRETDHGESFLTKRPSIQKMEKNKEAEANKKGLNTSNKPPGEKFIKSPQKSPTLKLFKQLMKSNSKPKLKIKPTEDELREILERIYQEVKIVGV